MLESAIDLIGVLLGLIALWFMLRSLWNDEGLRRQDRAHGRRRHSPASPHALPGPPAADSSLTARG